MGIVLILLMILPSRQSWQRAVRMAVPQARGGCVTSCNRCAEVAARGLAPACRDDAAVTPPRRCGIMAHARSRPVPGPA
ncbi:hypothetical protein, partial [Xanthomonas translucens]|uniref:hypothetical protein n=1 Tax=Xanthomonas campestris pv. translucens TaxID=343 RepID=UPI001E348E24